MESINVKTSVAGLLILVSVMTVKAQTALDNYIKEGLTHNIILQQRTISLRQAEQGSFGWAHAFQSQKELFPTPAACV